MHTEDDIDIFMAAKSCFTEKVHNNEYNREYSNKARIRESKKKEKKRGGYALL